MHASPWPERSARRQLHKGCLAGCLGGLVACWAMNQWLTLWQHGVEGDTAPHRRQPVAGQGGQRHCQVNANICRQESPSGILKPF
jgi:hypothetical protein